MIEVSESTVVDAPVDVVFAFMDDPHNHVTVTPSLAEARNVESLANGGKRLDYTFRMAGVALDGELVETTHEPDERIVLEMRGQLTGEIDLAFESLEGRTRLTYTGRYEVPGRVLSAVAAPFVRRYNERELRTTLANVKTRVETGT
ncbi:SRPBCC family protein [Halosimplex litoreum]|uniref:SRPBCC family protein n=1 Tax=Halosimplex litoreum TaxID=1198301 RepID=A0A7T3FX38_9EURY|nr:SRPBCC family protein [Halosimplex litoreum]QPV62389.1 SRPBCC family protein [Halosimplex litoreum]